MTELEKLNTRLGDLKTLVTNAVEAITIALIDGNFNAKHLPGSWVEESFENQLNHLVDHCVELRKGKNPQNDAAHAVCRAVMMYIKRPCD